ncbi:Oxoglutarate/iron-dependent oxygenase [Neofusicoccum parvum]|nr:Oxoglutarate/iron-dependent oxygenase [Neofusicoccum parvum]
MARQADQTESSQVRSVRNSMDQFNPVAILSGKRNLQCPTKMPHVYNVLDWFKPTHIWFEKVNGMANIRYRFEKLRKEKQSCLPHANVPAHALHDPYNPLTSGYAISKDWFSPMLPLRVEFVHNYRINYFTIPGVDGFIAHFIANKTVNEETGGPDDMWTELQTADVGLRRRPLGCSTLQGPMLTQHFAVNYEAEFNELLALGYFERQKIDYHDDGEFGLGPTIATLSIGAPASMRIRLKAKHNHGVSKSSTYVNRPPIPGCLKYEERKAAHEQLEALKQEDEEAYKARLKSLPSELGLQSKGHSKDVLNMHLGHGDIVIMHGAKIQEYYEHAVDPIGKLRFALTCRYIDADSLKPEDKPTYEVEPETGNYDGTGLP